MPISTRQRNRATSPSRPTRLFFYGKICWNDPPAVASTVEQLVALCNRSQFPAYSFGLRLRVFLKHRKAAGFRLLASDFPSSLPSPPTAAANANVRVNTTHEMLSSQFCLAPSGTGWGTRTAAAVVLGCIPVIVQDSGRHPAIAQAFESEIDWSSFAVRVPIGSIDKLPELLLRVDVDAKRAGMRKVWTRMLWRQVFRQPWVGLRPWMSGMDAFDSVMSNLQHHMPASARDRLGVRENDNTWLQQPHGGPVPGLFERATAH